MSVDPVGCLAVLVWDGRILRREWAPSYEDAGKITARWAVDLFPMTGCAIRVSGARESITNEELLRSMRRGSVPVIRAVAQRPGRPGRPGGGARRWRE